MQSQPRSRSTALTFGRDEWELLVTLPRRVLLASVNAGSADGATQGIAGIEAIAAGLDSPSPLVREVVGSIYAEAHAGDDDDADTLDGALVQTLAACRYAGEVVDRGASVDDAVAYRSWLQHIAAAVSGETGADNPFQYALGGVLR